MRASEESDETLAMRAGGGDRLAAGVLIMRHTDKIFAVSFRMLQNRAAAEDVVQETFLRLWRHVGRWRPEGAKFETWLYKIAVNICVDKLRRRGREVPEDQALDLPDGSPRADEVLMDKDRNMQVWAAIALLPERQRLAIALCHYQELSNIEAAEIMDVSIEAIESLLARGRRFLRTKLLPQREHLIGGRRDEHSIIAN